MDRSRSWRDDVVDHGLRGRRAMFVAVLIGLGACAQSPSRPVAASAAPYRVSGSFAVGGEGRWDLLDVDARDGRVLLSRSDHVDVVDGATGARVGVLGGTDGVHGVAAVPALGRGWSTNGKANSLTEFDLATLQRVRDIPLGGQSPDGIVYDLASKQLFAFNAKSNDVSVVDPARGVETARIAFAGNPELAVADGSGHLYVNIEDKAQLMAIDTHSNAIAATWALDGCEGPTGLAIDVVHGRLFSACDNGVMVVTDAASGKQVAKLAIGDGPDGAAFDPKTQDAFSPNGQSGTLSVVHEDDPDHFRVVQTVDTAKGARTVALDASTHRLYLPSASFGPKPDDAKQRPPMLPDSFALVVVSR